MSGQTSERLGIKRERPIYSEKRTNVAPQNQLLMRLMPISNFFFCRERCESCESFHISKSFPLLGKQLGGEGEAFAPLPPQAATVSDPPASASARACNAARMRSAIERRRAADAFGPRSAAPRWTRQEHGDGWDLARGATTTTKACAAPRTTGGSLLTRLVCSSPAGVSH